MKKYFLFIHSLPADSPFSPAQLFSDAAEMAFYARARKYARKKVLLELL
jgi:hypothetical protein